MKCGSVSLDKRVESVETEVAVLKVLFFLDVPARNNMSAEGKR